MTLVLLGPILSPHSVHRALHTGYMLYSITNTKAAADDVQVLTIEAGSKLLLRFSSIDVNRCLHGHSPRNWSVSENADGFLNLVSNLAVPCLNFLPDKIYVPGFQFCLVPSVSVDGAAWRPANPLLTWKASALRFPVLNFSELEPCGK